VKDSRLSDFAECELTGYTGGVSRSQAATRAAVGDDDSAKTGELSGQAGPAGDFVLIDHAQRQAIRFPLFLTRTVYDGFVTVPAGVTAQDEAGRLWGIVWMTRFAILRSRPGVDRLSVALYVRNDNRTARLVKLVATCGPLDLDDPAPAITVMMPDED